MPARWQFGAVASRFVVEAATTPCVVQQPWKAKHASQAFAATRPSDPFFAGALRALLNPANPSLAGTSRPYFPRGGPIPPPPPPGLEKSSSGWGGLDAGEGMLYPAQVVDGLVHAHAGSKLKQALAVPTANADGVRCGVGAAFITPAFELVNFDVISHAPTPFWPADASSDFTPFLEWAKQLSACYTSGFAALRTPWEGSTDPQPIALATPLLGAGAAGAPLEAAAQIAAHAAAALQQAHAHAMTTAAKSGKPAQPLLLRFVMQGEDDLAKLRIALEETLGAPAAD